MARSIEVINALIAKHEAAIAKLVAERDTAPTGYVATVGEDVSFVYGRAETKRRLTGKVLGVTPPAAGVKHSYDTVTILTGEGAEAEVVKVLSINVSGPANAAEEVVGEDVPTEALTYTAEEVAA